MLKRVTALLLAVLLLLTAPAFASVRIAVQAEADVSGTQLTLGDIAVFEGDADRIDALRRIRLGSAPPPGARMLLSRDNLIARLDASQADFSGIEWKALPAAVSITGVGQGLDGQTLAAVALNKLKASLPARPGEEIRVSLLQEISDQIVPPGRLDYQLAGQSLRFGVPQTAYLLVSVDSVLARRVPVKFELKRFTGVLTAAAAIEARETVTADMLQLAQFEVSRLPAGYLTDPGQAVGQVVRRSLPAGAIIYSSHLDQPLLIKRGSLVTIAASAGGVEANAPGIAQKDGRAGQFIPVRNTISGRLLTARVVDKGRVEVALYDYR
ncbi:MAG: flagellar basal body P-ring formation chaperone FlgA [Sporomusaceae bacterium]|nr:flagellar basal body P-ring formation chaperone FlgA [Sporomusaceae bacterium]